MHFKITNYHSLSIYCFNVVNAFILSVCYGCIKATQSLKMSFYYMIMTPFPQMNYLTQQVCLSLFFDFMCLPFFTTAFSVQNLYRGRTIEHYFVVLDYKYVKY